MFLVQYILESTREAFGKARDGAVKALGCDAEGHSFESYSGKD